MISLALLIAALVVFIIASFPVPSRVNLVAVGLALLTAWLLIGHHLGSLN